MIFERSFYMTEKSQALRLADEWLRKTQSEADRRNSAYDHYGMGNTPENVDPLGAEMVAELRRLHAQRDALLEALKELTPSICHVSIVPEEKCAQCGRIARARAAIKAVEGE